MKQRATRGNSTLSGRLYDPLVDAVPVRHWWNGELRRLRRRDIYLYEQDGRYNLEARTGGKDGTSRWAGPMAEQDAVALAEQWRQGQDGWREA